MKSRSERVDNRNKAKENMFLMKEAVRKRKVRKWEKIWVPVEGTTMKVFKWVPVSEEKPALAGLKMIAVTHTRGGKKGKPLYTDPCFPDSSSSNLSLRSESMSSYSSQSSGRDVQNEDSNLSIPDSSDLFQPASCEGSPSDSLGSEWQEAVLDFDSENSIQQTVLKMMFNLEQGLFNINHESQ